MNKLNEKVSPLRRAAKSVKRGLNWWGGTQSKPNKIVDRIRQADDAWLIQLALPNRNPSKGSPAYLQQRAAEQELKRRYGITPSGDLREYVETLNEKAVSRAQQRYFGMVAAGKIPKPKGMKMKDVEKFARTKHKGLPGHVDEGVKSMRFIEYLITESKKSKPDYIDLDKDGNKKESMKKAAKSKEK